MWLKRAGELIGPADDTAASDAVTSNRRKVAAMLTVGALALAWYGQSLTTRDLPGLLRPLTFLSRFLPVYPNARELSAAFILMFAGALLLALASKAWRDDAGEDMIATTRGLRSGSRYDFAFLAIAIGGLILWWLFLRALNNGDYRHLLNLVLLLAVALIAAPFVRRDLMGTKPGLRASPWLLVHLAFAVAVFVAFMYVNGRDLTNWKYSAIGDEYANFHYAEAIARGGPFNPWSHAGPDNLGAVAGSAGQALFMRLGNEDNFAWKFYNVVITGVALIPFYFLVRSLLNVRIAVMATFFFGFSHYVLGYAHHDLRLDAVLPTVLAFWLLVAGLKRDSSLLLFLAGMSLALGFYAFESGRGSVLIAALFMLTFGIRAFRPSIFIPLALGFILLALPLFATDGVRHVIDQMSGQSAIDYSEQITGDRWGRFRANVQYSLISFNYQTDGRHYVWGSLVDPLTAMLFILGMGVSLARLKRPAYRLIMIWLIIEVAINGLTNPYPQPPISRMAATVPPIAVLAAIACDTALRPLSDRSLVPRRVLNDRGWWLATSGVLLAVLLPAIVYFNLHRFLYEMPRNWGSTREAVSVRGVMTKECKDNDYGTILVARHPGPLFSNIFGSYRIEDRNIMLMRYEDAFTVLNSHTTSEPPKLDGPDGPPRQIPYVPYDPSVPEILERNRQADYFGYGCVVAVPDDEGYQTFVNAVRQRYPSKPSFELADLGGKHGGTIVWY